jgi:multidrug efflux pump subunit AcrB
MWIVRLALRLPHTFVVLAILIAIFGLVTISRMPTDIFPEIEIPVVAVVWVYAGIAPDEIEQRIVSPFERVLVSLVNDIEHIESQSLNGTAVIKIFLQPGARIEAAVAEVSATAEATLRGMPPGTFPPIILRYSATNVPIVQASLGSDGSLSEQRLFDLATNFFRPGMATVPGAKIPYPYGGRFRQVMVDIDPQKLFAWKLSANDIVDAVNAQNLILPAGTAKIGQQEYNVRLNSSPTTVEAINDLPIRTIAGRTIYLHDVANVRDGFIPQTNIVNVDGKRGVLQPILKSGGSTLDIIKGIGNRLPDLMATLPKELKLELLADQSVFIRAAIAGVVKEGVIAAGLTGLMILLFLGSWRSTLIVVVSIPLSILVSIIALNACGLTLNVMTLGGMALAVGILVDDATVTIENIHLNLSARKPLVTAILDGAHQIAVPAFVSTLCICIVFVPIVFITGTAKSLFVPLALAVVFAMLTSYLLSRTLVPTMIQYLLVHEHGHGQDDGARPLGWAGRIHHGFNQLFEALRSLYGRYLGWAMDHRLVSMVMFTLFVAGSCVIYPLLGHDFFPTVDAGQIRFHVRAPPGTRIEETELYLARVEKAVREIIPAADLKNQIDNMGIPNSGINLALSDGSLISSADGEVLITLNAGHAPTAGYVRALRSRFAKSFPELMVYFQPPDMVTQVLNFGLPAPIDVQIAGPRGNQAENLRIAEQLRKELSEVPGAVDVHLQQVPNTPELHVDVDRSFASQLHLAQKDVANTLIVSLSSSGVISPNYWLDPKSGVEYTLAVQTPQFHMDSAAALANTPITTDALSNPQLLGNLAHISHGQAPTNVTHYNTAPTYDVLANVQDRDLGRVSAGVDRVIAKLTPTLPRGTTFTVRGQALSMNRSFQGLAFGLIFAVVLVYFLMVMNFQSWIDPLIILMALPGALGGILWMLFVTDTPISVPSLMGATMSIGVATANSILVVTFANDRIRDGLGAAESAWLAGVTRLRPVMMTALAMIIGMMPMSLGLGEGGEQNAPLGRAVIGGLLCATLATLFFVPVAYSALHRRRPASEPVPPSTDEVAAHELPADHE